MKPKWIVPPITCEIEINEMRMFIKIDFLYYHFFDILSTYFQQGK